MKLNRLFVSSISHDLKVPLLGISSTN